jgi:hypothetical protein
MWVAQESHTPRKSYVACKTTRIHYQETSHVPVDGSISARNTHLGPWSCLVVRDIVCIVHGPISDALALLLAGIPFQYGAKFAAETADIIVIKYVVGLHALAGS